MTVPPSMPVGARANPPVELMVLVLKGGRYSLDTFIVLSDDLGPDAIAKLKKKYKEIEVTYFWWNPFNFFYSPVISIAILTTYSIGDVEAQSYPREVFVESIMPSEILTAAWNRPSILRSPTSFVDLNPGLIKKNVVGSTAPAERAIFVKEELNRCGFIAGLAGVLLSCIISGIIVGSLEKSLETGIAATLALSTLVLTIKAFHL